MLCRFWQGIFEFSYRSSEGRRKFFFFQQLQIPPLHQLLRLIHCFRLPEGIRRMGKISKTPCIHSHYAPFIPPPNSNIVFSSKKNWNSYDISSGTITHSISQKISAHFPMRCLFYHKQ